jgi:hypothetical protein
LKTKPQKLTQFFEGNRRKAFLIAWSHLKTKAGESRLKLEIKMPLLNEPVVGINGAIAEAFEVMAKDDSRIDRTSLNVELEGMTLECFTTDDPKSSKHPSVSSTGVKMVKLAIVASGEGEKRELNLLLVAYLPASIQLRDWAWTHLHSEFHAEAVYSQSEMEFSNEPAEEEEDEDEDGDEFAADRKAATSPEKDKEFATKAKPRVN